MHSANADLKLSPKYDVNDWRKLDLDKTDGPGWSTAVDIFYDRIYGRFLAPVEAIENHPDDGIKRFCGFAVLAIDCLIIETLYQFYNGVNETNIRHKDAFWSFFHSSSHFNTHFTKDKSDKFYTHFRCGILHQAQTKRGSRVRIGQLQMVQMVDSNDLDKGLIIDRKQFHKALLDELQDYAERLRNPKTKGDYVLRDHFKSKMSFVSKVV
jgi:hypothetical protein